MPSDKPDESLPSAFREIAEWLDSWRRFWEQGFDRLDAFLTRSREGECDERPTQPWRR
jgi:hypothetical protein